MGAIESLIRVLLVFNWARQGKKNCTCCAQLSQLLNFVIIWPKHAGLS